MDETALIKDIETIGIPSLSKVKCFGNHAIYFRSINPNVGLDACIYRYLSLSHMMELIDNQRLYIPNRTSFTDLRDKLGIEKMIVDFSLPVKERIQQQLNSYTGVPSYREKKWYRTNKEIIHEIMSLCISCWTLDRRPNGKSDESFLMWKAYKTEQTICRIGTTIQSLIDSIEAISCDILISDVDYGDKCKSICDKMIFQKSMYYDNEQEVRLVALSTASHVDISINPQIMIKEIITSPFLTPLEEIGLIQELKKRYNLFSDIIKPSKVMEYPYYKN